jgi:hypothetical protein
MSGYESRPASGAGKLSANFVVGFLAFIPLLHLIPLAAGQRRVTKNSPRP